MTINYEGRYPYDSQWETTSVRDDDGNCWDCNWDDCTTLGGERPCVDPYDTYVASDFQGTFEEYLVSVAPAEAQPSVTS